MLVFLIVLALVVLLGIALGFVIKWQLDLPRAPASGGGRSAGSCKVNLTAALRASSL